MAKKEKTARTTLNSGRSCPTKLTEDSKRVLYGFLRSDKFKADVVVPYNDYTEKKMQYRPAVGGKPRNGRAAAGQFLTDKTIQIIRDLQLVSSISTPIAGKFEKRTALINDSVDNIRDHVMYAITDINKGRPFVGWTYLCTKVKKLKVDTNPVIEDPYDNVVSIASAAPTETLDTDKLTQGEFIDEKGNFTIEKKDQKPEEKPKAPKPGRTYKRTPVKGDIEHKCRTLNDEVHDIRHYQKVNQEILHKEHEEILKALTILYEMGQAQSRVLSTLNDVFSMWSTVWECKKKKEEKKDEAGTDNSAR